MTSEGLSVSLLTVALAVAGVAVLVGALRRDPTVRTAALGGDQGTRLAVGGLVLVLIGWALNLSIGDWTMAGGTLSLAAATFGVVVIVVAPRWSRVLPGIPVAWIGAAFGVLVAILAIDQWGALMHHGILTELGPMDYAAFLAYVVGVVGIIAGGVLAGMPTWQARPKAPAPALAVPPTNAPVASSRDAGPVGRARRDAAHARDATSRRPSRRPRPPDPRALDPSGDRALPERHARPAVPLGHDLGEDRERGLGRRATAEVEPDRAAQPGELRPR